MNELLGEILEAHGGLDRWHLSIRRAMTRTITRTENCHAYSCQAA
jgi:hypothetical protein